MVQMATTRSGRVADGLQEGNATVGGGEEEAVAVQSASVSVTKNAVFRFNLAAEFAFGFARVPRKFVQVAIQRLGKNLFARGSPTELQGDRPGAGEAGVARLPVAAERDRSPIVGMLE